MICYLDIDSPFPPTANAWGHGTEAPGLLAAGGDLRPARLLQAYRHGIFPWYSPGQPPLWWSPDPRMVLPARTFKLSRSLRKTLATFLRTPGCSIRFDTAFADVIRACAKTPRDGQNGTWIVDEMIDAYTLWHELGAVHSIETWIDGTLAGGLYGVALGRMFFGESMYSHRTDASKIALAALVAFALAHDIELIDCQQNTSHLASLGAQEISRTAFEAHLLKTVDAPSIDQWFYDPRAWSLLDPRLTATTRPLRDPS